MKKRGITERGLLEETRRFESPLDDGSVFRSEKFSQGAVEFSRFFMEIGADSEWSTKLAESAQMDEVALEWQSLSELQEDHGLSTVFGVISDSKSGEHGKKTINERISKIRRQIGESSWSRVERRFTKLGGDDSEDRRGKYFILAVWAELFAEPFGEFWLAAVAQHAFFVEENDFAFGYLTAMLDIKRNREAHLLRGLKTIESARLGAKTRASQTKPETARVIAEMERLRDSGHSISRAAEIAHSKGHGTSADANRKLWTRSKQK